MIRAWLRYLNPINQIRWFRLKRACIKRFGYCNLTNPFKPLSNEDIKVAHEMAKRYDWKNI